MPELADWMAGIPGNTRVSGIIMPGSHDAGVAKTNVELNLGYKESWAVCQHGSIGDQAFCGSRFFDCRVFYQAQTPELEDRDALYRLAKRANLPPEEFNAYHDMGVHDVTKNRLRFGHFSGERQDHSRHGGVGGAYGGVLKESILQAITFVHDHPNEFLILRFSHSGWPDKLSQVMKYWYEKYKVTRNWQDYIYRTPGNIVSERLENLRGKLVLIFDGQHTSLDPALGLHKFSKYEDTNSTPAQGLTTCGTYAASSKVKVVAEKAKEAALRHFNGHARDHLHFVYYQQTMMLESIESATTAKKEKELFSGKKKDYTGGARTNMPKFLADLQMMAGDQGADVAHYANVISHDFVDPTTCRQIIGLNKDFQW